MKRNFPDARVFALEIRVDHDRSARRVHQAGCGLHDRELRGADEVDERRNGGRGGQQGVAPVRDETTAWLG